MGNKTSKKSMKTSNSRPLSNDLSQYAFWITGLFVAAFLFIAPYSKALFNGGTRSNLTGYIFNQPIYTAMIFAFLFAFLFGLFLYAKDNARVLFQHTSIPILFVWLIPTTYILTLFLSSVSVSQTIHAIVIHSMYACFLMFAVFITRADRGSNLLSATIISAGYMIIIFGLLNWLTGPFYKDAVMLEPGRLRLTSVFQYANSYAAFLIAILLATVYLLVCSRSRIVQIAAAVMVVPTFISLILTFSRGGLVILPVVAFIILFLLSFRQQLMFMIYMVVAAALSVAVTPYLSHAGMRQYDQFQTGTFITGCLALLVVTILYAGFAHLLNLIVNRRYSSWATRLESKRFSRFVLPISGVLLGSTLAFMLLETSLVRILPVALQQRIENINLDQHSVLERATFYRDAMKIIEDYPIFGAGGSGWSILYEQYQNNPYTSTQAHSYFIQHWIETGIVGFIVLLAFIAFVYYRYLRYYSRRHHDIENTSSVVYFIVSVSILMHSMIDFDMSYVYIGCLVFLCFGAMIGASHVHEASTETLRIGSIHRWLMPTLVVITSAVLLVTSIRFLSASNHYVQAMRSTQGGQLTAIQTPLDQAIDLFAHSDYLAYRARLMLDVYRQTNDEKFAEEFMGTAEKLLDREPNHQIALEAKLQYYLYTDRSVEAEETLQHWLQASPWNTQLYDRMVALLWQLAHESSEQSVRDKYYQQALSYYDVILERIQRLADLPENQLPGKSFEVTPNIASVVAQIYLAQEKYTEARVLLEPHIEDTASHLYPEIMRAYLVSLILQDKLDDDLYRSFVDQYPDEAERIEQVVAYYKHNS